MKKYTKSKTHIYITLLCACFGFFLAYHFFIAPMNSINEKQALKYGNMSKKLISTAVLINKIKQKQELITLQVEMAEKMTIDDSWGSLVVFKKLSVINFVGQGIYSIDLSSLTSANITINKTEININLPSLTPQSVNIDENETTFEPTQNGLFRFGDIKVTPIENQLLIKKVKEKMLAKMKDNDLYEKAIESSTTAVKQFINLILQDNYDSNYNIKVTFKK